MIILIFSCTYKVVGKKPKFVRLLKSIKTNIKINFFIKALLNLIHFYTKKAMLKNLRIMH